MSVLEQNAQEQERLWQIRLERVRYEAERAERQFDAVEPENRLVVRTLERRWNEKLQHLADLEQAYAQALKVERLSLSEQQRQQVLRLACIPPGDLALTNHHCTHCVKKCSGCRVLQVALTPVDSPTRQTKVKILWHTGATSELLVSRPSIQQKLGTPEEVVQAIRELAAGRTDTEIATELNRRGLLSAKGRCFTTAARAWIRLKYQISKPGNDAGFARSVGIRSDGSYSTSAKRRKTGSGDSHHPLLARQGNSGGFSGNPEGAVVASGNTRNPQDAARQNPPSTC